MIVYVIDDDEAVGRTIARTVTHAGWASAVYQSAERFLSEIEALPFGCILLDIRMPGMTGLELLEILNEKCPEWPVIMVTGSGEVSSAVRSFRQGAINFLQKPFKSSDLIAAIDEAAAVGKRRRAEAEMREKAAIFQKLSKREMEVLRGMAEGHPSKVIAYKLGLSTRTVESYRASILDKIGARNASQAIAMANGCGILDKVEDTSAGPLFEAASRTTI